MKNGPNPVAILVVDDDEDARKGSKGILERMGYRTLIARRGEQGLEILEKEDVGIIVLDLNLPGMGGLEMLRWVCQKHPNIRVITTMAGNSVDMAVEAMKTGACDLITKPFEPDQLSIAVKHALEKDNPSRRVRRFQPAQLNAPTDPETEESRIHAIINSLPIGVLVTDAQGQVVLLNPTFRSQMDLTKAMPAGQPIRAYIPDEDLCGLVMEISKGRHVDFDDIPTYEFSVGSEKFLLARSQPVLGEKHACLGAVLALEDITALKVLDRLKSEFVAKVSHELRSPLSTIHEQLAVVLSDLVGQVSSSDEHLLSRAKEKTQGLISLIGDLLDISRIESGAVCQEPKPVLLDELLDNIIDFLNSRAAVKQHTLTLTQSKEPLPAVKADPLALESIFGNLITNAINYTPEKGRIEIKVTRAGVHIQVEVIDNGFGIEARHIDKIFERFYRVKNEKTRYITGTGLGLPIVKGLVDSLGGRVSVESTPNRGSTFTVLLPAIQP